MTYKQKHALTIVLTLLLAVWMLMAGSGKLMVSDEIIGAFHRWALPRWLIVPVGLAEVLAAILLFVPKLRSYALAGIVLIMTGAIVTHIRADEYFLMAAPMVVILLVILVSLFRSQLSKSEIGDTTSTGSSEEA